METVRLNMASIIPIKPDVVGPCYINSLISENTVSEWRNQGNELEYHLVETEHIEGTTCYDKVVL